MDFALFAHHGYQHGDAADQAGDEADHDFAVGELESIRNNEEAEQEERHAHDDTDAVALQLLKHW